MHKTFEDMETINRVYRKVGVKAIGLYILVLIAVANASCVSTKQNRDGNLIIKEQGAFAAGGNVIKSEGTFDALKPWNVPQGGQTRHGDHADVFYQIPPNAKRHSMVFLHGYGQSRRSWQTTADGREGFANTFLRKGYGVYLVDQPGRGHAGQTTKPGQIAATPDDQTWYTQFRIGLYPKFNEGVLTGLRFSDFSNLRPEYLQKEDASRTNHEN
jgi:hypothetical protein